MGESENEQRKRAQSNLDGTDNGNAAEAIDEDIIVGSEEEEEDLQPASEEEDDDQLLDGEEDLIINDDDYEEELDEEEEEENPISTMNTGKYFDEGVMEDFIDIAADEMDEAAAASTTTLTESGNKRGSNKTRGQQNQTHQYARGSKQHSSA